MTEQNAFLCLLYSALGGITSILSGVPLIIPHDRAARGLHVPKWHRKLGLLCYIILSAISTTCYTLAPWYGPVSLYRPAALSARLLSNLIIIGFIMRREKFEKDTRVATYSIALSTVLLPTVGPGVQNNQKVDSLMLNPYALAWIGLLTAVFVGTTLFMFLANLRTHGQPVVQACLLGVTVSVSVLSGTVSRALSVMTGREKHVVTAAYVAMQLIWAYENAIEPTTVASLVKFVPVYTCSSLIVNAITGIIVWEDWRVVYSWSGYVSVLLLMVLGVYLMSDLEFSKKQERKRAKIFLKLQELFVKGSDAVAQTGRRSSGEYGRRLSGELARRFSGDRDRRSTCNSSDNGVAISAEEIRKIEEEKIRAVLPNDVERGDGSSGSQGQDVIHVDKDRTGEKNSDPAFEVAITASVVLIANQDDGDEPNFVDNPIRIVRT